MIDGRIRILLIVVRELPAGPAFVISFRIRLHNGYADDVGQTLQMPNKICSVRKWAEEAYTTSYQLYPTQCLTTYQCKDDNDLSLVRIVHPVRWFRAIHHRFRLYVLSWRASSVVGVTH